MIDLPRRFIQEVPFRCLRRTVARAASSRRQPGVKGIHQSK
jgi:hypothetical protein